MVGSDLWKCSPQIHPGVDGDKEGDDIPVNGN